MHKQKLYKIGGSLVLTIPAYLVDKFGLKDGASVGVDHADGIILLKPQEGDE